MDFEDPQRCFSGELTTRIFALRKIIIEPVHEKTNNLGFRPGLTQTGLYSHRKELEA